MANDKIFAQGFFFDRKPTAPSFVIGRLSIKESEAVRFIQENANQAGYVNLDVMQTPHGKYYIQLDTYVKPS